jgi:hypothetical protein
MKTSAKIAVGVYLLVMAGCVVAFLVQRSVVYGDHINPGRQHRRAPVAVTFKDKQSGEVREAKITFVDDSIVYNPAAMGNEIEEHLQSLIVANLATGIMVLFVVVAGCSKAEPVGAGDA